MARDTPPDRISATLRRQRQRRFRQPRGGGGGGGVTDTKRQFTSGHARTFHWNTLRGETTADASPPSNSFSSVVLRQLSHRGGRAARRLWIYPRSGGTDKYKSTTGAEGAGKIDFLHTKIEGETVENATLVACV
eukprot:gene23573-biopygen7309